MFVYAVAGWEGSAHDSRILRDSQEKKNFVTPVDRYWLGDDAGYPNREFVMVPYRGRSYHLKEQRQASQRASEYAEPANYKELFNLRHARLRNAVERIFGILKRRFKILAQAPEYPLDTQFKLVYAVCGLQNFIREQEGPDSDATYELLGDTDEDRGGYEARAFQTGESEHSGAMDRLRDKTAKEMWEDYRPTV